MRELGVLDDHILVDFGEDAPVAVGYDGHGQDELKEHDGGSVEPTFSLAAPVNFVTEATAKRSGILRDVVAPVHQLV